MSNEDPILINPQLAKTLVPKKFKIVPGKPWWLEPKLDGLRGVGVCKRNKGRFYSRNGKPFWNTEHILEELSQPEFNGNFVDGEFFCNNWNQSMSILKRQEPHPDALNIKFYVFDMVPLVHGALSGTETPLKERYEKLKNAIEVLKPKHIVLVEHKEVVSYEEIQLEYVNLLAKGFEGGMAKDPEGPYELGRRSPYWLKIKPWTDADLVITDAFEGNGKHQGKLGKVLLEGDVEWNDKTYKVVSECGTGFSDEQREEFWALHQKQELVDQIFEVKFQEITADNSMRFPVFNRWRTDRSQK